MAFEAATMLNSQNCFTALWRSIRKAFVCTQPTAEDQQHGQQQNEQDVDVVGMRRKFHQLLRRADS